MRVYLVLRQYQQEFGNSFYILIKKIVGHLLIYFVKFTKEQQVELKPFYSHQIQLL